MKKFTEQNIEDMKSLSDYVKTHGSYTSSVEQIKEVFGPAVNMKTLYGRLREFGLGRKVTGSEIVFVDTVRSYVYGNGNTPFKTPEATIPTPDLSVYPFQDKSAPEAAETPTVITEPMVITDIQITDDGINSRDVYDYLEIGTKYSDWIKRAVDKYDFIEGEDFVVLKIGNGTNAFVDYMVTTDMAKELCMVSNTEKGKATRKYFITMEKTSKPTTTGNPLVDALVSMQLEQNQMNSRLDALEVKVDDVVALPAAKPIRTIPTGYTSISSYTNKRPGLSRDVIKLLITLGSIGTCEYDKVVEG